MIWCRQLTINRSSLHFISDAEVVTAVSQFASISYRVLFETHHSLSYSSPHLGVVVGTQQGLRTRNLKCIKKGSYCAPYPEDCCGKAMCDTNTKRCCIPELVNGCDIDADCCSVGNDGETTLNSIDSLCVAGDVAPTEEQRTVRAQVPFCRAKSATLFDEYLFPHTFPYSFFPFGLAVRYSRRRVRSERRG